MPLEIGLDLGTKEIGAGQLKKKKCLILDIERYMYQAAVSDMSGNDIAPYGKRNQVEKIIEKGATSSRIRKGELPSKLRNLLIFLW